MQVDEGSLRRFNSQSSGATTLVGDHSHVSPLGSHESWQDKKTMQNPLVFTGPDKWQWIDLDIISPKLLTELCRQNGLPAATEEPNTLAKGAAKIKAWARQSKRGVDIRLRRKVNEKHDEVIDYHLEPNPLSYPNEKSSTVPWMPELPGALNAIHELPDTSAPQELPSEFYDPPSRSSTGESVAETLPRYEPPAHITDASQVLEPNRSSSSEPLMLDVSHRPSSSATSILHTPTGGLSLRTSAENSDFPFPAGSDSHEATECITTTDDTEGLNTVGSQITYSNSGNRISNTEDIAQTEALNGRVEALEADLDEARKHLEEQRKVREDFQRILAAMREEGQHVRDGAAPSGDTKSSGPLLNGLHVAASNRYETETDCEPPSPQRRISSRNGPKGKRPVIVHKVKRTAVAPKSKKQTDGNLFGNDEGLTSGQSSVLPRRRTIPKRLPADADPEDVWIALIQAQTKMLGPEHPLVFQAKAGLSTSRNNEHQKCEVDVLSALRQSKDLATQMLGQVHPLVPSFSANLEILERMIGHEPLVQAKFQAAEGVTDTVLSGSPPSTPDPPTRLGIVPPSDRESQTVSTPDQSPILEHPEGAEYNEPAFSTRATPLELPTIVTTPAPSRADPTPPPEVMNPWANTWSRPHQPRSDLAVLAGHTFAALTKLSLRGILWLQRNYGPEPGVVPGKVRVRWTCSCGEQLYDDFRERRQGAARELEAYLNRPRTHQNGGTPTSPSSSQGSRMFSGSSNGHHSTQTSWSSFNSSYNQGSPVDTKGSRPTTSTPSLPYFQTPPEPPWLLTCATESRHTPKLAHLDMSRYKITSDKDLAMSLREHYFNLNRKWYRSLKIRGLTTIEFVQFEVHQNKFADIRKCPDMPPPSVNDYEFEPGELMPPVGSTYLLHLFKHPEDYDGELITYLRAPKKSGRLHLGVGWGINLVEGFLADKVWMLMSGLFALGSLVFGIVWAWMKHDIQGAFGVSAWICTVGVLAVGWMQACLG